VGNGGDSGSFDFQYGKGKATRLALALGVSTIELVQLDQKDWSFPLEDEDTYVC